LHGNGHGNTWPTKSHKDSREARGDNKLWATWTPKWMVSSHANGFLPFFFHRKYKFQFRMMYGDTVSRSSHLAESAAQATGQKARSKMSWNPFFHLAQNMQKLYIEREFMPVSKMEFFRREVCVTMVCLAAYGDRSFHEYLECSMSLNLTRKYPSGTIWYDSCTSIKPTNVVVSLKRRRHHPDCVNFQSSIRKISINDGFSTT